MQVRRPTRARARAATLVLAAAAVLSSCSSAAGGSESHAPMAPAITSTATFTAHGSVGQAYVLGATPGAHMVLADPSGHVAGTETVDRLGGALIRDLTPGPGYTFREVVGKKVLGTSPFRVLSTSDTPPASFYADQHMHVGLNYITMRDGVQLAATVRLPPGKTLADGPFPTVIEESGYAIAAPHSLIQAVLHQNGESTSDPLVPSTATAVGSLIAPELGFATVSLQMRGTGCSGGAFGLFDLPTTYDGYDAVQIVGSQPWVAHHKVGMVGISFSGISQMFVAGTRPPDLAAIAPMSLTNDLYASGFPGGIYNSGFAAGWIAQRVSDAQAAPQGGQQWAKTMIADGDKVCLANQVLHLETRNVATLLASAQHRVPALYDKRAPATWAAKVDVPVFISGAFQDEQTGGQWPAIIPALAHDPHVFATIVNGTHVDSLGPGTISRWLEFLDIFVAQEVPKPTGVLAAFAGPLYQQLASAPSGAVPPLRFTNAPTVTAARHDFETQTPRVRVLFDNGGGSAGPGAMQPVWEEDYTAWPPPAAVPTVWTAGPGGTLTQGAVTAGTVSFRPNPAARPANDLPNGNAWAALPPYQWAPVVGSEGVGFITPPLAHDVVAVGPASMNLEVESTALDTDLQVTISEVRPDGKELFIQSGVLRASDRALNAAASTAISPVPTYLAQDAHNLPRGKFVEVRVPILPFAYAFRAGSRIRVTISAPGGDRPAWEFGTYQTHGDVVDTLHLGGVQPTQLVLPVVSGITPPDPQPACPSLRGQPCRTYVPAGNGG